MLADLYQGCHDLLTGARDSISLVRRDAVEALDAQLVQLARVAVAEMQVAA
ncbi:hypothetical protein [Stenotrophomonas maltophilia]|uniref:hypothetical protein n=1 Tax=Stenotrophomonas maltophilia TaxID=40324 RepID=UPI0015DF7A01|nr:hypothetical protein [Stenotrophomonas maltophilia]